MQRTAVNEDASSTDFVRVSILGTPISRYYFADRSAFMYETCTSTIEQSLFKVCASNRHTWQDFIGVPFEVTLKSDLQQIMILEKRPAIFTE